LRQVGSAGGEARRPRESSRAPGGSDVGRHQRRYGHAQGGSQEA